MHLAYAQVEIVVAAMQGVHESRLGALQSKFKRFRLMGFPHGVNAGAGKHFKYDLERLLLVILAFELLRSLILPEGALALIGRYKDVLLDTAAAAAKQQGLLGDSASGRTPETTLLMLLPQGNGLWRTAKGSFDLDAEDRTLPAELKTIRTADLGTLYHEKVAPPSSALFLDIFGIVEEMSGILLRSHWVSREELSHAFQSLGASHRRRAGSDPHQ